MDIGTRLRLARQQQGKSVRDIAQSTKLSRLTIEAIENNDFARLPGGIFARACMRSCAQEVGLDPEEIVKAFIVQCPGAAPESTEDIDARPRPRNLRGLRWFTIAVVLTVLAATAFGAYYWFVSRAPAAYVPADRGSR